MENGKLRPFEPLLMSVNRVADGAIGVGSFLALSWVYGMYNSDYLMVGTLILFMTMVTFRSVGLYRSWRVASFRSELHQIVLGCVIVYVLLLLAGYSLKVSDLFSRRVVFTWMIAWPLILGSERFGIRAVLWHYRKKGRNIRKAVIAGAGEIGERLARYLEENPWSGTVILGFFDDQAKDPVRGHPVWGSVPDLPDFVRTHHVDVIYIALPSRAEEEIQNILKDLSDTTASVYLVPDIHLFDLLLGGSLMYFDTIPVIALRDTPLLGFNAFLKRAEDLVLSLLVLTVISPVMLAIAAAIRLTSPGPALFKQWRYGLDGRPITIYKFRTMSVCEDGYEFNQVRRSDPRITRLGTLLRRTSLDELPQFINVLQGRMSIVGPRPHPVAMNEEFRKLVPGYMLRHKVRPGITGLAQIRGWRGGTETLEKMEMRIQYDLDYLRQWSLLLDLKIIALTVLMSVWKTNAY
jgi:putative colanic acid biosysnthesis UDP-glucose lipid carrier transferase